MSDRRSRPGEKRPRDSEHFRDRKDYDRRNDHREDRDSAGRAASSRNGASAESGTSHAPSGSSARGQAGTADAAAARAVTLVDSIRQVYNRPCASAAEGDGRGSEKGVRAVREKTDAFCERFSSRIVVTDLSSGAPILRDHKAFRTRYQTVFRESGRRLKHTVHARVLFVPLAPSTSSSDTSGTCFVLDLERHVCLVTPVGAALDGALGLRGPREQALWALYEVCGGEVRQLWLSPSHLKLGSDGQGCGNGGGQAGGQAGGLGDAKASAINLSAGVAETLLAEFKRTREWGLFEQIVRRRLGSGHSQRSGALHSLCVATQEMQGRRPTMEDQVATVEVAAPQLALPASCAVKFLGLFDGHGGAECARFAAEAFPRLLRASDAFAHGKVAQALRKSFLDADEEFAATQAVSGTCALVAVIGGGKMWLAHAGDSRAVLCTGESGEVVRLTEDHKPDEEGERRRLVQAGGDVVFGGACWRVTHKKTQMMLATSRSLGDTAFKMSWERAAAESQIEREIEMATAGEVVMHAGAQPRTGEAKAADDGEQQERDASERDGSGAGAGGGGGDGGDGGGGGGGGEASSAVSGDVPPLPELLLAEPTVTEREIETSDRFVILACDGVWDVLSDQQACDYVRQALSEDGGSAQSAVRKLVGEAYAAGSLDNISAIVAVINHCLS